MRLRRLLIPATVAALLLGPVVSTGTARAAAPRHVSHVTYNPVARGPISRPMQGRMHPDSVTGLVYSTNWSGYVATSSGAFTSVTSSWIQQGATCGSTHTAAAFWVGLDGYTDGTLEQTGTAVDCIGGVAVLRDWYEMVPSPPVYYGQALVPGDSMTATVDYNGSAYVLTLTDSTRGWTETTTQYGGYNRSSAEVIAEAPGYPLATFGNVNFQNTYINGAQLLSSTLTQVDIENPPNSGNIWDYTSGIKSGKDFCVTEPGFGGIPCT
jgi:hypothetical protein